MPVDDTTIEQTDETLTTMGGETTGELPEDSDDVETLRQLLNDANQRADSEHEAFLRARADFQNFKRRQEEDRERLRAVANEGLILGLLPVMDNFERALQSAQSVSDLAKLTGGVQAILRQLQDILAREGAETIAAAPGDSFDPNIHNAVLRDETADQPENTIVEELQRGYLLGGRVLRPAMVKVATGGGQTRDSSDWDSDNAA